METEMAVLKIIVTVLILTLYAILTISDFDSIKNHKANKKEKK
jgi:hypothetical protein